MKGGESCPDRVGRKPPGSAPGSYGPGDRNRRDGAPIGAHPSQRVPAPQGVDFLGCAARRSVPSLYARGKRKAPQAGKDYGVPGAAKNTGDDACADNDRQRVSRGMTTTSSHDRLAAALERIDDLSGEGSRACLTVYRQAARAAADAADARARAGMSLGPLDGAIVTIKDLFDVAGEVTRAGSKVLAEEGKPAEADAPVVRRLRAGGAVIVAKTNMSEFAFTGIGINPHYGTPGNPADRARAPGGSSSGAAVRPPTACARLRSAATPAARAGFRRRCAASSASSRAGSASRPSAPSRCPIRSTPSVRWRTASQIAPSADAVMAGDAPGAARARAARRVARRHRAGPAAGESGRHGRQTLSRRRSTGWKKRARGCRTKSCRCSTT